MLKLGYANRDHCAQFLDALECLDPLKESGEMRTAEQFRRSVLREMPDVLQNHLAACGNCQQILDEFAGTRQALQPLAFEVAEQQPGPWFASKVMNAIRAQEREMDLKDAVWFSVRKFAPRLAVISAVTLLVMGTWMAHQVRTDQSRRAEVVASESVFDSGSLESANDDVLVYSSEAHR